MRQFIIFGLCLGLISCHQQEESTATAPPLSQSTRLTLSHQFPASHNETGDFRDQLARRFAAEVKQASKQEIDIRVYPNHSLFEPKQQFAALQNAQLDLAIIPLAYAANLIPELDISLMPALVSSYEVAKRWPDSLLGESLEKLLEDNGVILLSWIWQAGGLVSKQGQILRPEDIDGLRIRGAGRYMNKLLEAAGGIIHSMPSSELHDAMARDELDATVTSSTSLISYRLHEVSHSATSATQASFWYMLEPLLMSRARYESLSDEQQSLLRQQAKALEAPALLAAQADDAALEEIYRAKECSVSAMSAEDFSAWRELAAEKVWPEFAAQSQLSAQMLEWAKELQNGSKPIP